MPPDRDKSGAGAGAPPPAGEVYFEFIQSGAYMRVTAIDARTGREVTIVGDARAPRAALEQVALNKLRRALSR